MAVVSQILEVYMAHRFAEKLLSYMKYNSLFSILILDARGFKF